MSENSDPKAADYINDIASANRKLYSGAGLTREFLARKHFDELNAVKLTRIKVKGAVSDDDTDGKVIARSGLITHGKGENSLDIFGDGDTVIEVQSADMAIRQRGRREALAMRSEIPTEKTEVAVTGISRIMREVLEEIDGNDRGKIPSENIT